MTSEQFLMNLEAYPVDHASRHLLIVLKSGEHIFVFGRDVKPVNLSVAMVCTNQKVTNAIVGENAADLWYRLQEMGYNTTHELMQGYQYDVLISIFNEYIHARAGI